MPRAPVIIAGKNGRLLSQSHATAINQHTKPKMASTSTISNSLGVPPSKGKLARIGKSLIHGCGPYAEADSLPSASVRRADCKRLANAVNRGGRGHVTCA